MRSTICAFCYYKFSGQTLSDLETFSFLSSKPYQVTPQNDRLDETIILKVIVLSNLNVEAKYQITSRATASMLEYMLEKGRTNVTSV